MKKARIALLFDFNGTLVNDTDCHLQAWIQVLQQQGASLSVSDMRKQWYGKNEEIIERIMPLRFSIAEKQAISLQKENCYLSTFNKQVAPVQGLLPFLAAAANLQIPMAIGSAATPTTLHTLLTHLNIAQYFTATVCANEVAHSKPHPETYLLCAQKLQIPVFIGHFMNPFASPYAETTYLIKLHNTFITSKLITANFSFKITSA